MARVDVKRERVIEDRGCSAGGIVAARDGGVMTGAFVCLLSSQLIVNGHWGQAWRRTLVSGDASS